MAERISRKFYSLTLGILSQAKLHYIPRLSETNQCAQEPLIVKFAAESIVQAQIPQIPSCIALKYFR